VYITNLKFLSFDLERLEVLLELEKKKKKKKKKKNTKKLQNLEMMKTHRKIVMHKNNGKKMQKQSIEVTEDNVADVVSMMTGIP
jgi:ATP-dependent Clp protease ATP-binding subunit ClpC